MELREVEKYRPIPRGGLKLLAPILLGAIMYPGALVWLRYFKGTPMISHLEVVAIFATCLGFSLVCEMTFMKVHPVRWIGDYWRRNVRGYSAWYWRDGEDVRVAVTQRGKEEAKKLELPSDCQVIKIPLGGYFNPSGGMYYCDIPGRVSRVRGWTVKCPSWSLSGANFPRVTLVDDKGQALSIYIFKVFLASLKDFRSDADWSHLIMWIVDDRDRFRCERDEAKKRAEELERKWKTACQQREDALSAIAEAIKRIDATKRFIKSDQAQTIRTWLNGRLAAMAPVGAPGTVLGARETLTQPAACEIGVRACKTGSTAWDPKKRLPPL